MRNGNSAFGYGTFYHRNKSKMAGICRGDVDLIDIHSAMAVISCTAGGPLVQLVLYNVVGYLQRKLDVFNPAEGLQKTK